MSKKRTLIITLGAAALAAAGYVFYNNRKSIPHAATAITGFDQSRYLGKWYEIARLDFRFEKNLNNTTAEYLLNDNGTIKVVNRGFNYKENKWEEATGKAKFAGSPDVAMLKVSFFGPFYSGYNVIALDDHYQYALVAGESLKYLWILSREKTIPEDIRQQYLAQAESIGYKTQEMVWPEHDKH